MSEWTNETAEWYADKYGEYATNRLAVDGLVLSPSATVVDVGCGTGSALRHAASRVTSGRLIGIDPVPRMVKIARERAAVHPARGRIEIHCAPAEAIPLAADCADVVLAFDSLGHWSDVREGLAEVRRILRADGTLAVVKDGRVPGESAARTSLAEALVRAGFTVAEERHLEAEDVSFTLWVCTTI